MRGLPAVHRFFEEPALAPFEAELGREAVKNAIGDALEEVRSAGNGVPPFETLVAGVIARLRLTRTQSLLPVVNATGILLHTNLGRAPLAPRAWERVRAEALGYTNLEYDLDEGARGSRYARLNALLQEITGAQAGIVVNNCAAAVLLVLDTFARGREVVVARNQLIEIGGGFRIPDVLARSGASLVEVGATNKVYLHDYERALHAETALLFRTHRSNFEMIGFTHDVDGATLAALGRRAGVLVFEDLGSGALIDVQRFGLPHERTVQEALTEGIDLIAFSGDKLLGGPQAGILVGRAAAIARVRENPLLRALRVDKVTIALLNETLRCYRSEATLRDIPLYRMLGTTLDELHARARSYEQVAGASVVASSSAVGGGTLPQATIPSVAIAFDDPHGGMHARLRTNAQPVIGRIEGGRLLLDLRTIAPEEDPLVLDALRASR
ncbi:MAG: L-seryl-tRNA(Sec) selenium transferase [Candidatus Eremiobacteraeota bacterium]|nr:L-seryl-tRNA(Sec) selenium transferase [Candidatus Eremiobacteraeota bacterium]